MSTVKWSEISRTLWWQGQITWDTEIIIGLEIKYKGQRKHFFFTIYSHSAWKKDGTVLRFQMDWADTEFESLNGSQTQEASERS